MEEPKWKCDMMTDDEFYAKEPTAELQLLTPLAFLELKRRDANILSG